MNILNFKSIFLITCLVLWGASLSFANENLTLLWQDYRLQKMYDEVDGVKYTLDHTLIREGGRGEISPVDGYNNPELCDTCWLTQDATHYDFYYYQYTCWGISVDGSFSHEWREYLFSHENNDPVCDHIGWHMGDNICFRHSD